VTVPLAEPARAAAADEAVDIVVCYDYQCPYSARAVRWLEDLGPDVVRPRYRMFPLEQVNADPAATTWRLWEQPLDYEHYRGRPDRRSLAAFLSTAMLEDLAADGRIEPDAPRRFRLAVYRARFDDAADISDPDVLRRAAEDAGVPATIVAAGLHDEVAQARARSRLASDWAVARGRDGVFGVPTLILPGDRPAYLRLAREPSAGEGLDLLRRLVELRRAAPWLLELKLAEPPAG
jgi:DSBA-like thioredoxin domain